MNKGCYPTPLAELIFDDEEWDPETTRSLSEWEDDGQPSELTEWLDFDPDC
jgi:hypothetical protein